MQSNWKVIQSLRSKIQSPLGEIRNRAITTLYTKVSAKIISDQDLINANQLPGVLFNWINETTPTNKDCLYKTLSILHRYTFSQQGLQLLNEYEALQFLQEFRKFIISNETNVDQHIDIIKKIIKLLLPLENVKNKQQLNQKNNNQGLQELKQQQVDDSEQENQLVMKANRNKKQTHGITKSKQNVKKSDRHVMQFYCLSDYLPKLIDEELYSLLIQLKHGKKQSVLETLIKIEEIIIHWGYRFFGYKEELVRELVVVIEGKVYSEVACRIVALLLKQSLQMQQDIGIGEENFDRSCLKTVKLGDKGLKGHFQKITIEINFEIFQDNPFTFYILDTIINKNRSQYLLGSVIEYLLIAVQKFPFSGVFLPSFLKKILNNNSWVSEKLSNKFYQEELMRMINHCCQIQPDILPETVPLLEKLFPGKSFEEISRKMPNLSLRLQEQEIERSFKVLVGYSQSKGFKGQGFDFNLQLPQLQSHIKNLESGISGLPKNPQLITLYIDCILTLSVSVAKQDSLMSFYPKIKSLILKISQHEYLSCRVSLFENILMAFNSSEKINYLAQSFMKSELMKLIFTDGEFYKDLLEKAMEQVETIAVGLEITKVMQAMMKQENRNFLHKFTPLFYILSFYNKDKASSSISSAAKILVSRTPKKYQVTNILLSLFCKNTQERMKTYTQILGLSQSQDLVGLCVKYINSNAISKKCLKYSLSTIRNYMSIILNPKLQPLIKASAIEQMIECSQRIDLSLLENDEEFLKEILSIRNAVQDFIKSFINEQSDSPSNGHFFMQMVRIYSILQKRLRLQTNHLNQTVIKCLPPQLYLNILLTLCTIDHQEQQSISQSQFNHAITEFLMIVYYHVMTTFTSNLILINQQPQQRKKNTIVTHWVVDVFPHQQLIQNITQEISTVPKRNEFLPKKDVIINSQKQSLIGDFLKSYKLNIKSIKELLSNYIQNCASFGPLDSQAQKVKANIICPILQRQLSVAIYNLASSHSEVSFFAFFIQTLGLNMSAKLNEKLQEIIPHLINQLHKPTVPQHVNLMIIRISNAIGWKRTKAFDALIQQFNADDVFHLKLFIKLPKLGTEQMAKIIKATLAQIDQPKSYRWIYILWQILLKPSNIKTLILSSSEYTQLLVLNALIKCIQNDQGDQKLINYSIILLHQLLNEVYFEARKIPLQALQNYAEFDEEKEGGKTIEMIKLVSSLSIGPTLMKFILEQFETSNPVHQTFTLQNLCFLLQALRAALNVQNFCISIQLSTGININHERKMIKLFVISLNEYISKSNSQLFNEPSCSMLFSSVLNFVNSLLKNETFCQCANQIDLLDFSMTLFNEKSKSLGQKHIQPSERDKNQSQYYMLFSSILEYSYLRVQQNPKQHSHYLLSSTNFLQASFLTIRYLKNYTAKNQVDEKIKNYVKEMLQKFGKVLHSISLNQEDYFIFKLNHVCQEFSEFNLLESFACLTQYGNQNFFIFLMRFILIWQGKAQSQKQNQQKKTQFQLLNPTQIFEDEEEDSSIQERQLFSKDNKSKSPYQNHWIYKLIDLAIQRGHIRYCKSLISLSLPAKMFLIEKAGFAQYVKKMANLIDSKIIYESTTKGKKHPKKPTGHQPIVLSSSRNSLISQNLSFCNQENQMKNQSQDDKLVEIEDFMKFLTALFAVHEGLHQSQKQQFYVSYFINNLNRHKDVLRKLFYSVDKLYTLSELITSGNLNKEFGKIFLKLINALSESMIFSQSLSNHLTEVTSPMLEESIQTLLKGISQPVNQQDSQKLKQSLRLLSTLSNHESVRSYIYKNKLIEELNSKMIRYEQKKTEKSDFLNLNTLYDIVGFYSSLSKYKDSHNKILNDKKVLEVLINQVYMQKSDLVSQKILQLLSNLSAYKLNKAVFMQNRQIHKTILGQLQSSQIEYKCHLLTLLYNLIYRHAPAVKIYRRKDVIQMIENISWQKFDNWENIKHIHGALLQVLKNQAQIPDKN